MGIFQDQLSQILALDDQDRAARMDRAWAAYYGRMPDPLKIKPNQPNDNVKPNKARVVVDKGVSFLFGDDMPFKLDEDGSDPAQLWLDACWAANKKMTLLHKLALNGGVCGHAFLRLEPNGAGLEEQFPRIVVVDPATVSVAWDPRDIERVLRYTIQFNAEDPDTHKVRNYRQLIERSGQGWTITDQESDPDSSAWRTVQTVTWAHPYAPLVDTQNLPASNEFWGISDLEQDVLDLNEAAAFTLSNAQRIIRYNAGPITVATGVMGDELDVSPDNVVVLPNPDAKLTNLEMQQDLTATMQQVQQIMDALHETARVPAVSTGTLDSIGPLSGVALAILYQPLVEKTKTKRLLYGDLLVELCRRLLDLGGHGPTNVVTISWPELLPGDPLQERQAYLLEDQMGVVSKQTLSERLGNDWETEKQRLADEHAQAIRDAQAAMPPGQPGQPGQPTPEQQSETLPKDPILNARPVGGLKSQGGA